MLLLWDIDGTLLLRASQAHRQALHEALHEVFEVGDTAAMPIETAGRTDLEIARELLLRCDVSAERIDERLGDLREAWSRTHALRCPRDLSPFVAPGVLATLEWLAGLDDACCAAVTGNLEPIARLKLARAGLARYFPLGQGAFGSDSEARAALPVIARRRAGRGGIPYPRARTIVIGDTPRDIACARADGLRCLAVATGPYPPDALAQADAVASDGKELRAALDGLLGQRD